MWVAIAAVVGLISTIIAYKLADNKSLEQKIIDDINRKRKKRLNAKNARELSLLDDDLINRTKLLLRIKAHRSATKRLRDSGEGKDS